MIVGSEVLIIGGIIVAIFLFGAPKVKDWARAVKEAKKEIE